MRYGPKTPWRGHSSSAFVSFDKHPRSRLFIEQSTWRGWAIESSQNSQNRNWNGTGALIKWSKTKPNGCVWCFLLGVACGYKKDWIHSGLLVFAKSSMIFQNITLVQKWPLNSKKNVRNFASQMGWVMTMSVVDCRLQIPSVSLFYQWVFFSKRMRVQIVETKPTDFQLLWSHIRNKRWWSSLRIAVVNFILAHLQLCHRQSNHKLVVFPAGCKKGYSFCTKNWCCFFCSTSCYK